MTRFHGILATSAVLAAMILAPVTEAYAQRGGGQDGPPRGGAMRMGGQQRGNSLLKDIKLTDAQKAQVDSINKAHTPNPDSMRAQGEAMRAVMQSGDEAAIKAAREKMQAKEKARTDAISAILTPEQRVQFEKNLKEMQEMRGRIGGMRGGQGGQGRGGNAPPPPPPPAQ